jgi:hypothetical protein
MLEDKVYYLGPLRCGLGSSNLIEREETGVEKKRKKHERYEKPVLEKLNVVGQGTGICLTGSDAEGQCSTGVSVES